MDPDVFAYETHILMLCEECQELPPIVYVLVHDEYAVLVDVQLRVIEEYCVFLDVSTGFEGFDAFLYRFVQLTGLF